MTMGTRIQAISAAVVAVSAGAGAGVAQAQQEDVQIRTVKVTDSIYMLIGPRSGNIGLSVGEDGNFMIDDQYAHHTGPILQAAGEVNDQPIKFLVNTHWHGDHTGGNENMAGEGTIIVAHENVRVRMSTEQFMSVFDDTVPPSPDAARPVITFTKSMTFHYNGDDIEVFHVGSAHTDGDSIVHFHNNNVLHAGDTYFNGIYPLIDVVSGGSIDGTIAAAEIMLKRSNADTKIIPGHGPLSGVEELTAYRDMLKSVRSKVLKLIKEGLSKEEIIAAKPSAQYDEQWGGGFINPETFIGLVHASLSTAG